MIYILTGKKNGIRVVFKYYSNGLLKSFEIEGDITDKHLTFLFWNEKFPFPYKEEFVKAVEATGHFDISMVHEDISFERFFEEYGYKVSRKRAETLWNKISRANKIRIFEHLPKYAAHLQRTGQQRAYPDTYLRNEKWEDSY